MAKSQKRSNRELKKPKANKPVAAAAPVAMKGSTVPIIIPKKKS
jgi:hypothetical protein